MKFIVVALVALGGLAIVSAFMLQGCGQGTADKALLAPWAAKDFCQCYQTKLGKIATVEPLGGDMAIKAGGLSVVVQGQPAFKPGMIVELRGFPQLHGHTLEVIWADGQGIGAVVLKRQEGVKP